MAKLPSGFESARAQWRWRGQARPEFAVAAGPGQESVWDYPRPPRLAADGREVVILWGDREVARTTRALRVLETSHPPSFYLPWSDVDLTLLQAAPGSSTCEWKGPARYWSLVTATQRVPNAAWSYPEPFAGAEDLRDRVAFYPAPLRCTVGGAPVRPQPGTFYGGWITPELVGPFKGDPGSGAW